MAIKPWDVVRKEDLMMKSDNSDCVHSSTKVDLLQWLRLFVRRVLRRRLVLKILLTLLRIVADLSD